MPGYLIQVLVCRVYLGGMPFECIYVLFAEMMFMSIFKSGKYNKIMFSVFEGLWL